MLLNAHPDEVTPAEVVALARLAESPEVVPPPHLRSDLEAKGWVDHGDAGTLLLTAEGRALLAKFD